MIFFLYARIIPGIAEVPGHHEAVRELLPGNRRTTRARMGRFPHTWRYDPNGFEKRYSGGGLEGGGAGTGAGGGDNISGAGGGKRDSGRPNVHETVGTINSLKYRNLIIVYNSGRRYGF